MRGFLGQVRTAMTMAAIGYAIVFVVSAAQGPRLPAIEAAERPAAAQQRTGRLVAMANAAPAQAPQRNAARPPAEAGPDGAATIGPRDAIRVHGGSVLTDLLSQ